MFVSKHGIAQHVSESTGQMLIAMGATVSTPTEAAECINRLVMNGDESMHEANNEFKRIITNPQTYDDIGMGL